MAYAGDRRALAVSTVRRIVQHVLAHEAHPPVTFTVTFLSTDRMRRLNRRTLGIDRSTDVIAFALPHDGILLGDVYVCPAVARRSARAHGIAPREELVRLVTHGALHVLGYDHPRGENRRRSAMWRRQETYVQSLLERTT